LDELLSDFCAHAGAPATTAKSETATKTTTNNRSERNVIKKPCLQVWLKTSWLYDRRARVGEVWCPWHFRKPRRRAQRQWGCGRVTFGLPPIHPHCPFGAIIFHPQHCHPPHPQHCHPERSEGSAVAFGSLNLASLPSRRPSNHNAHSAPSSSTHSTVILPTHSTVILNAVKDLRLPLRISTWRYFRVDDHPPRTRTKLLFMADTTPFTYGDEVCIINGEYKGRSGAVVGMNDPEKPSVFTIEFGDGSDAEIPAEFLERDPD